MTATFAKPAASGRSGRSLLRQHALLEQEAAVVAALAGDHNCEGFGGAVVEGEPLDSDERLAPAGARVNVETRVEHDTRALAEAIKTIAPQSDLIIAFGASAITDRRDVIPAAIEMAGGRIEQFGMPVDPGNLLLLASLGEGRDRKTVLGAPGCARSPKENGFDWVLQRLLAGVRVTAADIRRLGAGGLLMEIVSRGQPRAGADSESNG